MQVHGRLRRLNDISNFTEDDTETVRGGGEGGHYQVETAVVLSALYRQEVNIFAFCSWPLKLFSVHLYLDYLC